MKGDSVVDIGEVIFHHYLNFLIITWLENQRIYYDSSEPINIGHHSFFSSENDTSNCMVDIFSLILVMY